MAKKMARSGSTGVIARNPQVRMFFEGLAAEGLIIRKRKGARITDVDETVMKYARMAFNSGRASTVKGTSKSRKSSGSVSRLVGEGIPKSSMDELPWASAAEISGVVDRPHMLTTGVMAEQLRVSRETINQRRKAGKIIGVRGDKRGFRFPAWQINDRGQPYEAIEAILKELDGDHWAAWRFLEEWVPEVGDIGFQALAAGQEDALLRALLGRSYGSFS